MKEEQTEGHLLSTEYELPGDQQIVPGYKSSSGQMTAVFFAVSMVLAFLGYSSWTPDRLANGYDAVVNIVIAVGPVIAAVKVLVTYINSRGKIASNQLWANSANLVPLKVGGGKWGKVLEGIKTGLSIGSTLPIPGPAGKIIDMADNALSGTDRSDTIDEIVEVLKKISVRQDQQHKMILSLAEKINAKE